MPFTRFCDGDECSVVRCGGDAVCPKPEDWSAFVDDAAVISLNEPEPERRRRVLHQAFVPMGISSKVRDFVVERHPKGGVVGCFTSHQLVMRQMIERNPAVKWGMIFEDDARPFPDAVRRDLVQELGRFCAARDPAKPTWVQLGYGTKMIPFLAGSGETAEGFPSILKVNKTFLAHSYVVSRAAMDIIVQLDPETSGHYDSYVTQKNAPAGSPVHSIEFFATEPQMFFQCNCDTTVTALNVVVQRFVGMDTVQRATGYVAAHPYATLAAYVVGLALVALLVVFGVKAVTNANASTGARVGGSVAASSGLLASLLFVVFLAMVIIV